MIPALVLSGITQPTAKEGNQSSICSSSLTRRRVIIIGPNQTPQLLRYLVADCLETERIYNGVEGRRKVLDPPNCRAEFVFSESLEGAGGGR